MNYLVHVVGPISRRICIVVSVAVATFAGSAICLYAASFNDVATGNYNDNNTWEGGSANPAGTTADNVTIDSATVTITGAAQATNDAVTISSVGTLATSVSRAFEGATVMLNGGTVYIGPGGPGFVGGDFLVAAGSRYDFYAPGGGSVSHKSLTFTAPCALVVTNSKWDYAVDVFFESATITNNATLILDAWGGYTYPINLLLSNVTVGAANTLTVAGTSLGGNLRLYGNNTNMLGTLTVQSGFAGTVEANSSNSLGSATVNMNGGTLRAMVASALGSNTVYVNSGGTLLKSDQLVNAFKGTQIILNGGTLQLSVWENENHDCGGDVKVTGNSTVTGYRWASTLDSLDFGAPSTLTFTHLKSDGLTVTFRRFTVTNNATLAFTAEAVTKEVVFTNTAVNATNTITVTGTAQSKVYIHGPIGARLRGSADILTGTNLTLVDWVSGTLDYTGSASLDTAGGLWSGSIPADNTDLEVGLANNKGSIGVGGVVDMSGAPEDAGHVTLSSLAHGAMYELHLDLESGNVAAVTNSLRKNPLWTVVDTVASPGYDVRTRFLAPASGTQYFAWDNASASSLGDNVSRIKLKVVAPLGMTVILR